MKIAFVETPSPYLVTKGSIISLGMLSLATMLNYHGHDATLENPPTIQSLGIYADADIICLGGTSLEYPMTAKCAEWIQSNLPNVMVFFGGIHATTMTDEVVESGLFDAVCVGEGEIAILRMVSDMALGKLQPLYHAEPVVTKLDIFPHPDRSLIREERSSTLFSHGEQYFGTKSESIMTSRGCPNRCSFCASNAMWGRHVRFRSVDNVLSEIRHIIDMTGVRQFGFWDDTLTLNKKRCIELCAGLQELDIAWKCMGRAAGLDAEICKALKDAGCKDLALGFESGDQRVLDVLQKDVKKEAMLNGCRHATDAGLNVRGMFMTGTPGEREDSPELTIEYINTLNINAVSLFLFTPLPGSAIWNTPEKYNCEILTRDFAKYNEYCYGMENGEKVRLDYEPLIHNKFLTMLQMADNVERMRKYIEATNLENKG